MEVLNAIERFLSVSSGYGDGSGSGDGDGDGSGYGDGDGSGYGYGDGSGSGDGYGSGYGYGDGSGYGYGSGSGSGDGDGSGYGDGDGSGYGLISFNSNKVYYIDGIATVIERVIGCLARGFTIGKDLVTTPCYIAKHNNLFAHGETAKEAETALRDKIFASMDSEEKIEKFLEVFDLESSYPASEFFKWHNLLTGSCEFGRKQFCKAHGIDLENGMYTVKEFIEITKNDYGSDIIRQLAERIEE